MIITKLTGALGNQFFQYAAGKNAAISHNTILKVDVDFFKSQNYRKYELDQFNVAADISAPTDKPSNKIKESFENSKFIAIPNDSFIDGRWFDLRYFQDIKPLLLGEFKLKSKLSLGASKILMKIKKTNSIAIHVRKTDYLSPKHSKIYIDCGISYYESAVNVIKKYVKNPRLFVFSDDPIWVRKNLQSLGPFEYLSNETVSDVEDFSLMKACQNQITANSTFSYWAAWLNTNPSKIVVTPLKWFKMPKHEPKNLIPKEWIKIS